jgi:hypothetical protein
MSILGRVSLLALVLVSFFGFAGCGEGVDDPEPRSDKVGTVESEVRACAVRCADGYVLTRQCTCELACTQTALCVIGYHWDSSKCACVPDNHGQKGGGGSTGATCGSVTCAAGDVCCNASCGICTPPGGLCTQQVCTPL